MEDLLFLSRIREAARPRGLEVLVVRRAADLRQAVTSGGLLVLVDADSDRVPWAEAVRALREAGTPADLSIVAFLSHVDAARATAAREAGCHRVLARSAFVQELPRLVDAASRSGPPEGMNR